MTTLVPAPTDEVPEEAELVGRRPPGVIRVAFRMWRTRVGMIIVALLVLVAFFGRFVARTASGRRSACRSSREARPANRRGSVRRTSVTTSGPGSCTAASRFWFPPSATLLALVLGTTVGLIAAYNRGRLDDC